MAALRILALVSLPLLIAGCSPSDLGTVHGTVMLDGKPLPNALIQFYPKAGGGAAQARTGADGSYELIQDRDTRGARIGEYEVRISTADAPGGDYGKPSPETVPAKYNLKSELMATVEPGRNQIDFLDLDSTSAIIQPR